MTLRSSKTIAWAYGVAVALQAIPPALILLLRLCVQSFQSKVNQQQGSDLDILSEKLLLVLAHWIHHLHPMIHDSHRYHIFTWGVAQV
jgi:hypothetical protein